MRRGHRTCKVEGHQEAALGARAVVKAGLIEICFQIGAMTISWSSQNAQ
jgi:hypothetical protein